MQARAAAELTPDELLHAWNLGYAGYFVPLRFTPQMLEAHLRCGGVDLARSRVWSERGEPVGFSLLGVRGSRGWIGGFGVTPAFRGRGLSYRLFQQHVDELRASELAHLQLEVLTPNWARKVYERAGMRVTRTLKVLRGSLRGGDSPSGQAGQATPVEPGDAFGHLARLHAHHAPAWNREPAWVREALGAGSGALTVGRADRPAGAVVWAEQTGGIRILDAAAEEGAGGDLVRALGSHLPGRTVMVLNEPDGSPVHRALLADGFEEPHAQYEMHLAL
jgi:ribosomal protein S18 acetylase RimI-like enzyme